MFVFYDVSLKKSCVLCTINEFKCFYAICMSSENDEIKRNRYTRCSSNQIHSSTCHEHLQRSASSQIVCDAHNRWLSREANFSKDSVQEKIQNWYKSWFECFAWKIRENNWSEKWWQWRWLYRKLTKRRYRKFTRRKRSEHEIKSCDILRRIDLECRSLSISSCKRSPQHSFCASAWSSIFYIRIIVRCDRFWRHDFAYIYYDRYSIDDRLWKSFADISCLRIYDFITFENLTILWLYLLYFNSRVYKINIYIV